MVEIECKYCGASVAEDDAIEHLLDCEEVSREELMEMLEVILQLLEGIE